MPRSSKGFGCWRKRIWSWNTANPRVDLLEAIVKVTDKVPQLRVVLDHLPSLDPTPQNRSAYDAALAELRQRPQIYVKLSAVIHRVDGKVSTGPRTVP